MKTVSYSAALASANAIKTSIATVAAPVTYSGGGLNGAIGAAANALPRTITVTAAAHAASYVAGSTITITGTDSQGTVQSEVLTLVGTDGTETLVTTHGFRTVTSVAIAAQADTLGAFTVGVRDVVFGPDKPFAIRATAAGDLKLGYAGGTVTDTIPALAAKETVQVSPDKIYGDSSTTVVGMTVFFR